MLEPKQVLNGGVSGATVIVTVIVNSPNSWKPAMKTSSIVEGLALVFDMSPAKRSPHVLAATYLTPSTGSDTESMRKDFSAAGEDMRQALRQYGEKS